jgi:hypothetical protein
MSVPGFGRAHQVPGILTLEKFNACIVLSLTTNGAFWRVSSNIFHHRALLMGIHTGVEEDQRGHNPEIPHRCRYS